MACRPLWPARLLFLSKRFMEHSRARLRTYLCGLCCDDRAKQFPQRLCGTQNRKYLLLAFYRKSFSTRLGPLGLPANIYTVKSKSPKLDHLLNHLERNTSYSKLTVCPALSTTRNCRRHVREARRQRPRVFLRPHPTRPLFLVSRFSQPSQNALHAGDSRGRALATGMLGEETGRVRGRPPNSARRSLPLAVWSEAQEKTAAAARGLSASLRPARVLTVSLCDRGTGFRSVEAPWFGRRCSHDRHITRANASDGENP